MIKKAWVLYIYNLPSHYNCISVAGALEKRGIETSIVNLNRLSHFNNQFYHIDAPIDLPDIVFSVNQFLQRTDIPSLNVRKLKDLEASNLLITNKITPALNAVNKWTAFNILHNHNINTPMSILIDKETVFNGSIIDRLGSPFVLKLVQGATGSKYSLCHSEQDLELELKRLNRVYGIDHVIAQKYLDQTAGMIVTVGAVRGHCKRAVIRIGDPLSQEEFLGDTKANRTQIAYKLDNKLEAITDKVMDALDLDCARIDMMIYENDYYILEANPPGGLNIIDLMHNSKIADDYVDRMIQLYG